MHPPYAELIRTLREGGFRIESRFGPAREVPSGKVRIVAGEFPLRDKININLGMMELLQLIAGTFDPAALRIVAPKAQHELFTEQMAYGPRVREQVPPLIEALRSDPWTRQAVLLVASPTDGPTSAQPCTTAIQFLLRRGQLDAHVSMRSWDAIRGLPYDLMMFGGLTQAVANCLGVVPGWVTVTAGSLHVYDQDEAIAPLAGVCDSFQLPLLADWPAYRQWAKAAIATCGEWPNRRVPGIRLNMKSIDAGARA